MQLLFFRLALFAFVFSISFAQSSEPLSPHSRKAWSKALVAGDLKTFVDLLYAAQKARFPSTANDVAIKIVLREDKLPIAEREIAETPEFKMEAAVYLALAKRSKVIEVDTEALRKLAYSFIGKELSLESLALSVLAHLGDPRDVPTMAAIARSDNPNRYRKAIFSMSVMCRTEANQELSNISRETSATDKLAFLAELPNMSKFCGEGTKGEERK